MANKDFYDMLENLVKLHKGEDNEMTSQQFYRLAEDLTAFNSKINKSTRSLFLKRLREVPGAIEQAMALFGDRGVYYMDMKDINRFIQDTVKITSKGADRSKYGDYTKYSTSFKLD